VVDLHFPELDPTDDISFAAWARATNHPERYVDYFRRLAAGLDVLENKDLDNESFLKHESYSDAKHPRSINSYTDRSKAFFAPVQRCVDERLYEFPMFVKHTAVLERPAYVRQRVGGGSVICTDYSSFECHHRGLFADLGKRWLEKAVRRAIGAGTLRRAYERAMCGTNHGRFTHWEFYVRQTLMSGAMWTSSANGALNALLTGFASEVASGRLSLSSSYGRSRDPGDASHGRQEHDDPQSAGHGTVLSAIRRFRSIPACIEGDDAICACTREGARLAQHALTALGTKVKLEYFDDFCSAKFCGIVQPDDIDVCLTDPIKVLCNMFLIPGKYAFSKPKRMSALIRAKAMSYLYQFRECPVVATLAYAVLKRTRGVAVDVSDSIMLDWFGLYKLDVLKAAMKTRIYQDKPVIRAQSRRVVSDVYGVSPEWQLDFEESILLWADGHHVILPDHPKLAKYQENFANLVYDENRRVYPKHDLPQPYKKMIDQNDRRHRFYHPSTGSYMTPKEMKTIKKYTRVPHLVLSGLSVDLEA
jgi:hypothetical protein